VGAAFHRSGRGGGRRGFLSYLRLSAAEIFRYRPRPLVLQAGGEELELRPFLITFANGPQYGAGAVINPGGRLDDGHLEIVYFDGDGPIRELLLASPRLFTGGIEKVARYRRIRVTRAIVQADSLLLIHRDGDPVEPAERIELELVPKALEVVVPVETARDPNGPLTPSDDAMGPGGVQASNRLQLPTSTRRRVLEGT